MDAILERIVGLIPQYPNGEPLHGAKKQFCDSIHITQQKLSDWLGGRSQTYKDKLYEIAYVYNLDVEWLKTGKGNPYNVLHLTEKEKDLIMQYRQCDELGQELIESVLQTHQKDTSLSDVS